MYSIGWAVKKAPTVVLAAFSSVDLLKIVTHSSTLFI